MGLSSASLGGLLCDLSDPTGERTYGRVIGEGTFADVPVTSFLVYAGKKFEFKT